jgi:RHS repeat-associated protein
VSPTDRSELVFAKDGDSPLIAARPSDTGFTFEIILTAASQGSTHSFAVDVGSLEPSFADDGETLVLERSTSDGGRPRDAVVGTISAPVLFDAAQVPAPPGAVQVGLFRPGTGDPLPAGLSAAALASLGETEVVLTYTIDSAWLADPARAFPVVIDPTACISVGLSSGCDIVDSGGSYVEHYVAQGIPTTYPILSTWLRVGYTNAGDSFQNMRTLVYFDDVSLPDGAHVTAATLSLRQDENRDQSLTPSVQARLITKGWGTTSTWNQMAGAVSPSYRSPTVAPCSSGLSTDCTLNIDVLFATRAWYTRRGLDWKPNLGFQVAYDNESSANLELRFYRATASTQTDRPKLTITYEAPGVQIDLDPALGTSYSPSTMVAGQAAHLPVKYTNTGSITFNTTTDGAGLQYRPGYRWFDAKGKVVGVGGSAAGFDPDLGGLMSCEIDASGQDGAGTHTAECWSTDNSGRVSDSQAINLVANREYSWSAWAENPGHRPTTACDLELVSGPTSTTQVANSSNPYSRTVLTGSTGPTTAFQVSSAPKCVEAPIGGTFRYTGTSVSGTLHGHRSNAAGCTTATYGCIRTFHYLDIRWIGTAGGADSDSDGFSDNSELLEQSDPLDANQTPANMSVGFSQAFPAAISAGNNSGVFPLDVVPPTIPGQYTLRLELVHYRPASGDKVWASDFARPSLFYSRNKRVLTSESTRWTGSSVIDRADYPINVVAGGGTAGELRDVDLGDGSSLGIDLYSQNVHFEGAGGIGFDDLTPLELAYGYDSKHVTDCATTRGPTLRACGWYTSWDERLALGPTPGSFTYVGPSGNRHFVDTDGTGQLSSSAPVLLERTRHTLFDETKFVGAAVTVTAASAGVPAWSGSNILRASSNASSGGTLATPVDLNAYWYLNFAVRTTNAASAGIAVKIRNVTSGGDYPDRWFIYTVGTDWTTGFEQENLSGTIVNTWQNHSANLYTRIKGDSDFGKPTDSFQVTAVQLQSSSGSNSGYTYVDALRLEATVAGVVVESRPSFSANGTNAIDWTDAPALPGGTTNTYSVKVAAGPLSGAPTCTNPTCLTAGSGDLFAQPFATWYWKKVGGTSVAVEFELKDVRTSTTDKITYFAGPVAPPGAVNPIQISDTVPVNWTPVTRNFLDDGRQVLNFFNDDPGGSGAGAPPNQGPTPDEVKWIGYRLWAVDGNYAVFDHLHYVSVPNRGDDAFSHPSSAGDSVFVYDFSATYPDGSRHLFNPDGLLEQIADRDGNRVELDWTVDLAKTGQDAYTLTTIRAPTDATTSGSWTYERQIDVTYAGSSPRTVAFTEKVGTTASSGGRATTFSVATATGTTYGVDDVIRVKPARTPTCAALGDPSACLDFGYTNTTDHKLEYVYDPRYTATNAYRMKVAWVSGEPVGIIDDAPAGDPYLLRVLDFDTGSATPASARVLWQDAAALRSDHAIYTDLTSDGSVLIDYVPLACTGGPPANCTTNPPGTGSLASNKRTASEFDGLARSNKAITYLTTGASPAIVVTRQGTKAGSKVDNYIDPLTSGQVDWTQSPDQYFSSLKDSGGTNPDFYRTFYRHDHEGNEVAVGKPAYNARSDYAATVKSTPQVAANLLGYWRLGEGSGSTTAADAAPTPHAGTYTGGVTLGSTIAGALVNDADTAASFDGTNDVVTVPSLGTISGSYTVAAWARPGTTAAPIAVLGTRGGSGFSFDLKFQGGDKLHADIGDGSAWLTTTADAPLRYQTNRWYHVAYVVTTTGYTVFVDGDPLARGTFSGTPLFADGTRLLRIGTNGLSSTEEWFNGRIDEVAVYTQGLTATQVRAQYLAGRSVAAEIAQTLYDDERHPIQVDDQFLAGPGFESGTGDWDITAPGSIYFATSDTDGNVHQPADPEAPHSWASFKTGTTGSAVQDVALVPGQTFRFQVWDKRVGTTGQASIGVAYWRRSTASWTSAVSLAVTDASWTGHAWDITLPFDTDGRIRVTLASTGVSGSDTIYYDDAAVLTTYGRTEYLANGLPQSTFTFSPASGGSVAEIRARPTYTATASHPAILPTSATMNYVDGVYSSSAPDTDVTSTTTFDAWGRALVATDPDGVDSETSYVTSGNGKDTDIAWTEDGLDNRTTFAYDLVGNQTSIDTPADPATTTTFDQASRVVQVTPPSPGTPTVYEYDGQGFLTRTIANYVNGAGSGPTGLDDVATAYTYDAFGRTLTTIGNAGIDLGPATKTSVETYDLLGNPTASSTWSTHAVVGGSQGTFAGQRQAESFHEIDAGIARPAIGGIRGPGSLVPSGAPTPLCPDGGTTRCNSATAFDLDGQPINVTDTYGKIARTFRDLAGRPVFTIANYVDGAFSSSAPDTDLVTTTRYDILGRTDEVIDVLGRSTNASFDGLGRTTASRAYDDIGTPVTKTRTEHTAGGRIDRTSAPAAEADADSALAWTKTVYDGAGRATKTLAHFDTAGAAGLAVDSFETPETDLTIADDGIAERWTAAAGTFVAAGATATREAASASAKSGAGRLKVTTGTGANAGVEWLLDGTFKGTAGVYAARVWVLAPAGTTVDGRLGNATESASATSAGTGTWQPLDLTWDPTADRTDVRLAIFRASATATVDIYLDSAVLWNSSEPNVNIPVETAYDANGRVVASILPPGEPGATGEEPMVTRTEYDAIGRVTTITATEIAGAGTPTDANLDTETAYDALGRVTEVRDPAGGPDSDGTRTRYDYDRLGRLIGTWANHVDGTPSDGATVDDDVHSTFAHDGVGELIRYCPAKQVTLECDVSSPGENQAWHYAYDDAGHLVLQTPPDNQVATDLALRFWTYDAGGRLTAVCDDQGTTCDGTADGRHSVPTYDAVGRVTQLDTYTSATGTTLALRTETSYFGDGQVKQTKASEGSGPTLIDAIDATYDAMGRPDQLKRSTTVLADFTWNADGTLASRVDGDAGAIGTTTFAYDWADRLVSTNLPDAFSTAVPTFAWRADGLVKSRTFDAGSAAAFLYDRAKRPTKIAKGTLTLEQAYDRDGNVTSESRSLGFSGDAGAGTQTFGYDGLNRVLSSTGLGTGHNFTYEYDHDGNRTKKSDGTTTWTYGYDRTDQLSSTTGGPTIVGYNAFGDMTSKPEDTGTASTSWTYDLAGKLTSINGPGSADDATFTFDALGRFRTRVLAASTDTYSYLGPTETVLRIRNDPGSNPTDLDSIVTSAGDRLGVDAGSTMNWFLPDLHGSVAASLSANESTVTNAIRYDAWGDTLVTGAGGGTAVGTDSWKYQGRLDVSPSGIGEALYDMSARFYAPSLGQFTQLDSVMGSAQNPLSMNRFLYAHANPATLVDPSGHAACMRFIDGVCQGHHSRVKTGTLKPGQSGMSPAWKEYYAKKGRNAESAIERRTRHSPVIGTPTKVSPVLAAERQVRWGCTAGDLNCSVGDFQRMSMAERSNWVDDFQRTHQTNGWLNAVDGVIDAAQVSGIGVDSWFGTVDARILSSIQDGYVAAIQGGDVAPGGGAEWKSVWDAYLQREEPDRINSLIANAEAAAIVTGRAEARAMGRSPSLGEATALLASDVFRVGQRNRDLVRDFARNLCGPGCTIMDKAIGIDMAGEAVDRAVDERDYPLAFGAATSAFQLNRTPAAWVFPGDLWDDLYPR